MQPLLLQKSSPRCLSVCILRDNLLLIKLQICASALRCELTPEQNDVPVPCNIAVKSRGLLTIRYDT